jgi:hypothetical protein
MAPLEKGEEKTHSHQRHYVSLPKLFIYFLLLFLKKHGVHASIIIVIEFIHLKNNGILNHIHEIRL